MISEFAVLAVIIGALIGLIAVGGFAAFAVMLVVIGVLWVAVCYFFDGSRDQGNWWR